MVRIVEALGYYSAGAVAEPASTAPPRRVTTAATSPSRLAAGVEVCDLVSADALSPLRLEQVRLDPGCGFVFGDSPAEDLVLALAGAGLREGERGAPLEAGTAWRFAAGEPCRLVAGSAGLTLLRAAAGSGCDRHAPLGEPATLARLAGGEVGAATGRRSFQVLFGPENGCQRATLFVGFVPPGRAPWHFHLYDEIVWIWQGEGAFHLREAVEPLPAGSAVRIRPREVHIVENLGERELVLVGIFTPAGTPAAAYYAEVEGSS